jgi:mRNA-degrading endonuclease toxin of MazEF toxin-antitoxin module
MTGRHRLPVIEQGDIRWFRFEAPDKRRPVLALGRNEALPALTQVPVIPISTQIRGLRWEVRLSIADGLPVNACSSPNGSRPSTAHLWGRG